MKWSSSNNAPPAWAFGTLKLKKETRQSTHECHCFHVERKKSKKLFLNCSGCSPWSPDVFRVSSKQNPLLLFIRASTSRFKPGSLLLVFLLFYNKWTAVTLFVHIIVSKHTQSEREKTHSAPPFHRTDLIPPTRASSAENNHSCVGWESAANQSAAADMTWRHPTAHFVRDRRTNREAGEQKWKWKRQTTAL